MTSQLHKKSYWDSFYERDLKIMTETGDIGEKWFGETVEERVIEKIEDYFPKNSSITCLDIGCGNGNVTNILSDIGYDCLGIDFSENSIKLCTAAFPNQSFLCDNILETSLTTTYDFLFDKGTFDAIWLRETPRDCQLYVENTQKLLKDRGLLFITSCNLTRDELIDQFKCFKVIDEVEYPKFQFGGQQGQCVTTLIFEK